MRAIILAAGIGRRLSPFTDELPKCLLEIGGQTLLERTLRTLGVLGITQAAIVVGHHACKIQAMFGESFAGVALHYVCNDEYRKGSILSLYCARDFLDGGAVVMDADVLYHPEIMARLLRSDLEHSFVMDESSKETGEEMMLGATNGRVLTIARQVGDAWDNVGEGVGFFKLGPSGAAPLAKILVSMVAEGQTGAEYEVALKRFLEQETVGFVKVGDLPWTEIDVLQDLNRARDEIMPHLLRSDDQRLVAKAS